MLMSPAILHGKLERKQTVMCIASSSLARFQFLNILPTNVFIAFIHLLVTPSLSPPRLAAHGCNSPMQHN
jgi:hypothetical protein